MDSDLKNLAATSMDNNKLVCFKMKTTLSLVLCHCLHTKFYQLAMRVYIMEINVLEFNFLKFDIPESKLCILLNTVNYMWLKS